jgi:hypothetical protein
MPCNHTQVGVTLKYENDINFVKKADELYEVMYDRMKVKPESHSLKADLETGQLKGYILVCASFAMRMWTKYEAKDYFTYDGKNDTDPRYANWNPQSYWDFEYLG